MQRTGHKNELKGALNSECFVPAGGWAFACRNYKALRVLVYFVRFSIDINGLFTIFSNI